MSNNKIVWKDHAKLADYFCFSWIYLQWSNTMKGSLKIQTQDNNSINRAIRLLCIFEWIVVSELTSCKIVCLIFKGRKKWKGLYKINGVG